MLRWQGWRVVNGLDPFDAHHVPDMRTQLLRGEHTVLELIKLSQFQM